MSDFDEEDGGSDERPRLLGNSFMLSANCGRFALSLPFTSGNWQNSISQSVQLVAWQTGDGEPQELEMLVYPMSTLEGGGPNVPDISDYAALVLTRGVNAYRGRAGGVSYDTILGLPANGLRMRFAAVNAVLKLMNLGPGVLALTVNAGIYPVSGSNRDEEACLEHPQSPTPIPKGARAFRTVPGVLETTATLFFYDIAGNTLTSTVSVTASTAWTPIPRGAFYVSAGNSSYPGSGIKINYFESIFFQ